ncbi:DUF4179 domain-containing protein [Paenibacillus sp. Y412MC10]|uniref:DUF4179 domain-containing protein n=1 Tax=Geobacillus sp. (strain Y412MC10) TaxID=481743 RepID=UPI0011A468D6|nr:DUF4179 domain-containing protein [Paenibacillus sp. Y412MC10]
MKFKKKLIITAAIAAFVVSGAFGVNSILKNNEVEVAASNIDISKLPVQQMRGSFVYDVNDKSEAVGISDYVFVGKVVSNNGTTYRDIVTVEDENGDPKEVGTPYTSYTIQVLDDIKGKLKKDVPIDILKHGGITQDKQSVFVFENDELPEADKSYIFLGYAQPDGSILISGPNSNIPLDVTETQLTKQNLNSSKEYQEYQEAFQFQDTKFKRERFTSKYEE